MIQELFWKRSEVMVVKAEALCDFISTTNHTRAMTDYTCLHQRPRTRLSHDMRMLIADDLI